MPITFSPAQIEAIEHVHGPMLVIAGAGTGKTTVLVQRIARLIRKKIAQPEEILALTHTDNAAAEMAQRVRDELGRINCAPLQARTFHAYCLELLQHSNKAFRVLDKQDLWIYLRRRLRHLPARYLAPARNPGEFLDALLDFFERCKDELVDAAAFQRWVEILPNCGKPLPRVAKGKKLAAIPHPEQIARWQEIARIFTAVEGMLAEDNLGTFGHMITGAIEVLRGDRDRLTSERKRARFLLMDEFQDANVAQIVLAELLAGAERNVFAVGDPDQAIYRFRGASAAAFQEFAVRFNNTRRVFLTDNQRSHTPILGCSFSAIRNNPAAPCPLEVSGTWVERKPLVSARDEKGKAGNRAQPVNIVVHTENKSEAADTADAIDSLRAGYVHASGKHARFGVLYRTHHHRNDLVAELAERGIPFAVTGLNALDSREVRDLLACLRVMARGDAGSLFRVAALPIFSVDAEGLQEMLASAPRGADFACLLTKVRGGAAVLAAAEEAQAHARSVAMDAWSCLVFALCRFHFDTASPTVQAFSDFLNQWRQKPIAADGNLNEFVEYMDLFPESGGLIEVSMAADARDPAVVQLMTAHAAKGLEFDHVFVLHLDQNSFPANYREKLFEFPPELRKSMVPLADSASIHKQEERRLFYVAMTRARESLTLCARPGRSKQRKPTGFVKELVEDQSIKPYWLERQSAISFQMAPVAVPPAISSGVGRWMVMPPPAPLTAPLSASSIQRYETCPLQFKIARDWKVPGEVAASIQFGDVMHRVLRDYVESVRVGRAKNREQVLEVLRDSLAETRFDEAYQRELYLQEGGEQLREFLRSREAIPQREVIAVESSFDLKLAGVRVLGRVDRIDRIEGRRVAIVDYKTGTPRTDKDADASLQLSLYAIAARELWDYVPEELVFHNLKDNSLVITSRSDDDLRRERERVAEVAQAIAHGQFDATPGYHCRSCMFRNFCPYTEERVHSIRAAPQEVGVS